MQTAVTSFNELSASIKEKEKRLAEIQVLKTHIINYVKTKDVYADYRKCGYSKKFLEEHRQEILLHNAAKNAFDELHVKKIPKVKELNAEYAEILAEKKKLYGEYRQTKKDMQEIQRAKYDIDQFLKDDEEKKKERTRKRGITLARLLGFEENNIVTTIEIISQLQLNKDKYDVTKSFNQNLPIILNLNSDTIARTQEDKMEFIKPLVVMDKENKLSEYIWNGIHVFNEIYENEMKLTK